MEEEIPVFCGLGWLRFEPLQSFEDDPVKSRGGLELKPYYGVN